MMDVKIRQNGKNLKVFGNTIFVQSGDHCLFKLDVTNVDRILSQRLGLSENFGLVKDFDYFYSPEFDADEFSLTSIQHNSRNVGSMKFKGMVVALTSKGSLQIVDGKKRIYQLH